MSLLAHILLAQNDRPDYTGLLLAAGLLLIVLSIIMGFRKRQQRKHEPTPREQIERSRQTRAMHGELEQLMVEIEQLAKRMSAQLDNKAVQLERLIRQADQRIEQLNNTRPQDPAQDPPPAADADAEARALQSRLEAADEPSPATQPPEQEPSSDFTASVYKLADRGMSPVEIARQLDEHVGKVELVLALRQSGA